jgi:Ca2+-binding EF-hand superfamily protein
LLKCADALDENVTELETNMMIEMANLDQKNGVNIEDFINIMRYMKLIPEADLADYTKK